MESTAENFDRKRWGRTIGNGVIAATVLVLVLVILETDRNPRTDDASVRTNFIEIAPEVSGRLVDLPAKDNALVKKGGVLFAIDPRPYEYALQQALSDQASLEQQIIDERRKIAAHITLKTTLAPGCTVPGRALRPLAAASIWPRLPSRALKPPPRPPRPNSSTPPTTSTVLNLCSRRNT